MLFSAITYLNSIRAVVPTSLMIGVAPTVAIVHTSWRVVSLLLPSKCYYPVEDFIWGWYQKTVVFYFRYCTGLEVMIEGDLPDKKENIIMICNHQTTMDWIVADFLALSQGMVGHMRFVFKDMLKYFPLYGYIWGAHGGVFVRRDGTYNTKNMRRVLEMLMKREVPLYLVIFPEGTRFAPHKTSILEKSRSYAIQNELEPLQEVFTPRIKAFYCAATVMNDYLDAVNDATIIYEKKRKVGKRQRAPTMWEVLSGECEKILIKFDRIPSEDIPIQTRSEISTFKWLHGRFKLKDNLLKQFYHSELNSNSIISKNLSKGRLQCPLALPFLECVLATTSLTLLTALLLSNRKGRIVYAATTFGGTVLGWMYAAVFF